MNYKIIHLYIKNIPGTYSSIQLLILVIYMQSILFNLAFLSMCSNTYKLYSIIKVVYRGSQKSVANYVIGNEIPQILYRNPTEIPQKSHRNPTDIIQESHRNPTDIIQELYSNTLPYKKNLFNKQRGVVRRGVPLGGYYTGIILGSFQEHLCDHREPSFQEQ